jgi:hypothetical protein
LQLSLPTKAMPVVIFDAAGKMILQKKLLNNSLTEHIPLQNFSKGIITISVQLQNNIETVRVVY